MTCYLTHLFQAFGSYFQVLPPSSTSDLSIAGKLVAFHLQQFSNLSADTTTRGGRNTQRELKYGANVLCLHWVKFFVENVPITHHLPSENSRIKMNTVMRFSIVYLTFLCSSSSLKLPSFLQKKIPHIAAVVINICVQSTVLMPANAGCSCHGYIWW